MVPKRVIACMLPKEALVRLRNRYRVTVRPLGAMIPNEKIREAVAIVTTPYDQVDNEFLRRAPKLKIIAQFGAGIDNIDLDFAKARGVVVTHTPNIVTSATADQTLALILSVTRRLKEAEQLLGQSPEAMPLGVGLAGKSLGIIGLGKIGAAVARRAHAFGMKIYYANRKRANPTIERESTASYCTHDELFPISDVLTIHCDLNVDSYHLINADVLQRMKNSAIIINTSRANVIDETALAHALASGKLWGAGLDVFSSDLPEIVRHHPRVILSPHSGTATVETRNAMSQMVVDSIMACLAKNDRIPHRKI